MDALRIIWDVLFGSLIRTYNFFDSWLENAYHANPPFKPSGMFSATFISAILCGSAFTAMTFAELKNRNRWGHFALGFFVPVIYPAILYFVIPKIGVSGKEDDDHEFVFESGPEDYEVSEPEATPTPLPSHGTMDQNYFAKISKDETGDFRGPFILALDNGQILEIQYIVEALPAAISVQIGAGEDGKTIRLPYSKIQFCKTKERWLAEAEEMNDAEEGFYEEEGSYEEGDFYEDEGEK